MAKQQDSLTLHFGDREKAIDVDGFLLVFQNAISALRAIDKKLSTYGVETLQWRVIDAGASSPLFATIQGTLATVGDEAYSQQVIGTFVGGIEHLAGANSCPPDFNKDILHYVKEMARIGVRYDLRPVVSTGTRNIRVRKIVVRNADWAMKVLDLGKPTYKEYGSLEGTLRQLSVSHSRDKIVIVEKLTGEETPCYLRRPELDTVVREAWKKRVVATGEIVVDRETRKPKRILVDDVRILQERADLPQMKDLHGIDITGGVESSEYIRDLRDDD